MNQFAIDKQTLSQMVFNRLRDAIIQGQFKPGTKIDQDQIAMDLDVSKMPIREALQKLEERKFVKLIPHKGAIVTRVSIDNVKETYLIRTALESLAARESANKMDNERLGRLRKILLDARQAWENREHQRLAELNREFHLEGYRACSYQMLYDLILNLRDHTERYSLLHSGLIERTKVSMEEHDNILAAWEARNPDAAENWTRINLDNSANALINAIQTGKIDFS